MAVTSDLKLRIYNGALRRIGSRKLAALTDAVESRRALDDAWGSADNVVKWALERGEWNFAIRSAEVDYNPSITPGFGFARAFDKPTDFRRLASLCSDPYLRIPLTNHQYMDEAGYWFTDFDVLYIRYVSDDTDYGLNGAGWPEVFIELLEMKLAYEIVERITNSKSLGDRVARDFMKALKDAKSHDAMNEGVKFPPEGSWVRARRSTGGER